MRKIESSPLFAAQVAEMIKEIILSGEYKPGKRLNEVELSRFMGVSRSPIREALQRLAKERLVALIPRKGAFVANLTLREVEELFELRDALEVKSAGLAAQRASQSELAELTRFLEQTRAAIERDEYQKYPWDLDFHKQIAKCTRNAHLEEEIYEVNAQLLLIRHRSGAEIGRAEKALEEHLLVLESLKQGDKGRAEIMMESHIRISKNNAIRLFFVEASEPYAEVEGSAERVAFCVAGRQTERG